MQQIEKKYITAIVNKCGYLRFGGKTDGFQSMHTQFTSEM